MNSTEPPSIELNLNSSDSVIHELSPPVPWLHDLHPVTWRDPWRWLAAGWRDLAAHPGISLFYGGCFTAMGWAMAWMFMYQPAYMLALAGGFMMLSPFLCLGLYEVSRKREQGHAVRWADSLTSWRRNLSALAVYCGVLMVLEMLWSRAALIVFAVSFNTVADTTDLLTMLFDPSNWGFVVTYLVVGAFFASLIFATSVVAMPMLIDHEDDTKADAITAGLTSIRVCLNQPLVMVWWAFLIALVIGLSMLPALLGLFVAAPWIGHASWHAYRGMVGKVPSRPTMETP